ncbi:MAG: glycosyl transferase [Ignavibacteriae bacterium]|nr:glycosyl transferase [Ignavibacteriota bacterium]|tara:strand:- start:137 stop:772 length:636 start_codon:yes stop_codon:yes gene_type:complete
MKLYKNFTPLVSVILPTFNREKLLKRAIDSVINQTYNFWELIIADDGSEDNTFEIIKKYQKHFQNIRYFRHSNRKLPLTLNAGIQASMGDYLTFLGSDDEYKKEHIQLRVEEIMNENIDFIHGGVEIIGDPYVKDKNNKSKMIHLNDCTIGGTFFAKKEVFVNLNGFKDIEYSEDSEFFERVLSKYKIKKVNYPTYIYYRDTPDSICNNIQ